MPTTTAIAAFGFGDRVEIAGPVPDIADAYRGADLLVSAALHEGFGMVMAEATAYGLPVVAVTAGGAREAAVGAVTTALEPIDTLTDRLTDALRPLLVSRAARDRQAARALEAAESLPRWDETARIVRGALNRFLRGATR